MDGLARSKTEFDQFPSAEMSDQTGGADCPGDRLGFRHDIRFPHAPRLKFCSQNPHARKTNADRSGLAFWAPAESLAGWSRTCNPHPVQA